MILIVDKLDKIHICFWYSENLLFIAGKNYASLHLDEYLQKS